MTSTQIRAARERRHHTTTEAAAEVGVTERTWWTWEKFGAEPRQAAVRDNLKAYFIASLPGEIPVSKQDQGGE
jgi:DNA-binding XRE family transcriptional regulator